MPPTQPPYPDRKSPVADAFSGLPLPDGALPGPLTSPGAGSRSGTRSKIITEDEPACPDGLVEEVLWGLLHGLTAPVTGGVTGATGKPGARRA